MLRMSISRSYKAPEPWQIIPRPTISYLATDLAARNDETSPDRIGNPALKPELATGFDLALERYLPSGGVLSVGGFYREVDQLVRNLTRLRTVAWSTQPRFVAMPENISQATSYGLEIEVKGGLAELLPGLATAGLPVQLRAALNYYRSEVRGVPGPDNRLDGQQPWSGAIGLGSSLDWLACQLWVSVHIKPGVSNDPIGASICTKRPCEEF
jgi:iron complex outermembrane receptor protein